MRDSVTSFVDEVRRAVDARLAERVADARHEAVSAGGLAVAVCDAVGALIERGGKRLRPALTAAAHAACGKPNGPAVYDVGCAWELLQAYLLIHDDWMDGDATRRGAPTAHVALAELLGDAHLGAAAAVLAGDLACSLAQRAILEIPAEPAVVRELATAFARVQTDVVLGQAVDLAPGAADEATIEQMYALKTGSYSALGPVSFGAMLAGAGAEARDALARFGKPIGLAFQLRDDLLGAFGDPAETGKPVGSDVRARKRTILFLEARRRVPADEGARLDALYGRKATPDDEAVEWVLDTFSRVGARQAVEARVSALSDEAAAALACPALDREGARILSSLSDRLVRRST